MKKAMACALSMAFLFALTGCSLIAASPMQMTEVNGGGDPSEEAGEWNQFSTIADLSNVTWYLTQNYGNDMPDRCRYYEFWDDEVWYILVECEPGYLGPYLLFWYNRGLSDWYEYWYAYEPVQIDSAEDAGTTPEDESIYTLAADLYGNGEYFELYAAYQEDGKIHQILCPTGSGDMGLFTYEYSQDGCLESLRTAYCADFYDAFFTSSETGTVIDFEYNQDGSLNALTGRGGDDAQPVTINPYSYENGMRVQSTGEFWTGNAEHYVTYVRDENGRVQTATVLDDNTHGPTVYSMIYYPGGITAAERIEE